MSKINVLHILWTGKTGGAERFVRDIMLFSCKEKFNHAVCFLAESGPLGEHIKALGIPVYSLKMASGLSLAAGFRFLRVLQNFHPQIVHSHTRNYLINIFLLLAPNIKRIYSEHGGSFEPTATASDIKKYQKFYRTFIRHYHLVLTNAEYLREKIIEWTRLPADQVKIYNYGIESAKYGNTAQRNSLRQQWNVPPENKVVGIVGRLVEQKGIDDFIRVCHEIQRLEPRCSFVIVGNGPLRQNLEGLARQLNVPVLFLGDRQDLPELLPAFDVFVVTSNWEPFGIVLLESMASGVPVVGFKVPGMSALIEKGGGVLLEGRPHQDLARLTVKILGDPFRYEELAHAGVENVRNNYDVHRNINLLEQEYCVILTASSGAS
jgi:glycosyltransferase involved in cell wall biosynthesis